MLRPKGLAISKIAFILYKRGSQVGLECGELCSQIARSRSKDVLLRDLRVCSAAPGAAAALRCAAGMNGITIYGQFHIGYVERL